MTEITCDVAVIGAGTAGLAAHRAATGASADAVLIEPGPGGTTCARVGCMPSKLLIAAAAAAHGARSANAFGVRVGAVAIDGPAVMERVRRERDRFVQGVLDDVGGIPAAQRLEGRARFTGPTALALDGGRAVSARAVVIATGARTGIPPALQGVAGRVLTNETAFELADLPASLAVVGAGALGLELALAFARLGVRVAVFDKGAGVGGMKDPEVAAAARSILGRELDLKLGAEITATPDGAGVRIAWDSPSDSGEESFERVLAAAGRPPNLEGLGLDRAGVALDEHGTPVFDRATMRCGTSPIFIAGDADHDRPVLHEASREGRIAGMNAARYPQVEPAPRGADLAITFTDPEMAVVGGGWPGDDAAAAIGTADLSRSGRARVMDREAGLIRLYARPCDGMLLGAEMVGPEIEHLAHLVAWLVQLEKTAGEALALPFYHPTLEESLRTALRDVCERTGSGGELARSYPGIG